MTTHQRSKCEGWFPDRPSLHVWGQLAGLRGLLVHELGFLCLDHLLNPGAQEGPPAREASKFGDAVRSLSQASESHEKKLLRWETIRIDWMSRHRGADSRLSAPRARMLLHACNSLAGQYSSGRRIVVALRSASVITHSLSSPSP
jgi:hypothetical protein